MVSPSAGSVVLVPFPFSDLSKSKLRPALVVADAGHGDWVLCQITSNPYGDANVIELRDEHFRSGSLHRNSCIRPGKIFTANASLMVSHAGVLTESARVKVVESIVRILKAQK